MKAQPKGKARSAQRSTVRPTISSLVKRASANDEFAPGDRCEQTDGNKQATKPARPSLLVPAPPQRLIRDDDLQRSLVTHSLLKELAPLLGLDPERVHIRVDASSGARVDARGATGVMEDGEVLLHPKRYQPDSESGRYLLAHELAHAAQQRVTPAHGNRSRRRATAEAEVEADRIGRAYARRTSVATPRVRLSAHSVVADSGVSDLEEATKRIDSDRAELDKVVAQAYGAELARIIDRLSYGFFDWKIWDSDVTDVLVILQMFNIVAARALVGALPVKYRKRLHDNLSTVHYKQRRKQVLAVYWGSTSGEIKEFSKEIKKAFETMDLRQITKIEAAAAQHALKSMDDGHRKQLKKGKKREEIEEILAFEPDLRDEARLLEEALERGRETLSQRKKAKEAFTTGQWASALQQLVVLIEATIDDRDFNRGDALNIMKMLMPYAHLKAELRAIVDNLSGVKVVPNDDPKKKPEYKEKRDYLDRLIRYFPVRSLYANGKMRRTFFTLLTFRPAFKNATLAADLTDEKRFFLVDILMKVLVDPFTDRVTSEDAYIAFLLVKAMPAHARQAFFEAHGGERWAKIVEKLSQQQRESEALNFYSGGKDETDRNALLSQLLADEPWSAQGVRRLDALIRMAIAAGEHEYVFNLSERRKAYQKAWLKPIVDKYRLYDPNARDEDGKSRIRYTAEILKGTPWYTRGWLFGGLYQGGEGLDFILSSKNVELATKSIGGEGLNLVELQDLFGGNFLGARFRQFSDLGAEGKKARKDDKGVNFANVKWDTRDGILTMDTPKLEIDAIRYPIDDFTFQSGRGTIEKLTLVLHYETNAKPKPSVIDVKIGKLKLSDVVLISPDSMKSANELGVAGVHIHASAGATDTAKLPKPRSGAKTPVPIIGIPLGGAWNLFLGSMWNTLAGWFGGKPKAGIAASAAEIGENLLKPTVPTGFRFKFDSLDIAGITTSSGQFIESVSLKDVVIQGGGDAQFYERALETSRKRIEKRLEALHASYGTLGDTERKRVDKKIRALQKQHGKTVEEIAALKERKAEVDRLEKTRKESPDNFSLEQRRRLRSLKAQLSGAVLDIGSASIKGIAGVGKGDFQLEDVHGQGRSVNAALSLLTDSDKLKGFITGKEGRPIIKGMSKEQDAFTLDIGRVQLPPIKLAGAIPTAAQAKEDYERFEAKHEPWRESHKRELARLKQRMELAAARQKLLDDPGIAGLTDKQQDVFRNLERKLNELEAQAAISIRKVVMDGASFSIKDNETIEVGADELLIEDIRRGNLRIQKISGTDVHVGLDVHDGIAGLDAWRRNLQRLGVRGKTVVVTGIKNEEIGLSVDSATLMGIDEASLDVGVRNASARVKTKLVLVEGVRLRNFEGMLIKERDYLQGLGERKPAQEKRLKTVLEELKALDKLRKEVTDAEAALAKARTTRQKKAATERRDEAQRQLDRWAEGLIAGSLAISDLDVSVLGLGDVLSADFEMASALQKGITVEGRGGPSGRRIFSGATGTDVSIPGLSGERITLGATSGRVTHSKRGTLFAGIHIDSIAVEGIDWRARQKHAFASGVTTLTNIDVTAFVGPKHIVISKLDIATILADQIGYEDGETGMRVVVHSGGLGGIHVTNLVVDRPEGEKDSAKVTGKVVVDKVTDLRLSALVDGIKARGTLNGSDLRAKFVTDRKRIFNIGDLKLRGGVISEPGTTNRIHVSFTGLKGQITQEILDSGETSYVLKNIRLKDLTVGRSRWAGDGKSIEINGRATLRGVDLDAVVIQAKKGADGKAGKLKSLKIVRLAVAQITATDIHAHMDEVPPDPAKPGSEGTPAKDLKLASGTILGLEVTGLDLMKDISKMTGQVRIKNSIDLQKLRIAVGDAGKDQVVTTLSVKAFGNEAKDKGMRGRELRATLYGKGNAKLELGTIKEISGDFKGFGAKTDFSTGQITMSPIIISGDGTKASVSEVLIKDVALTAPKYRDGKGTRIKLESAHAPAIRIKNVTAKFGEVTDRHGKKSQGMTDLAFSGMKFDYIEGNKFHYTGKTTISKSRRERKVNTIKAEKAQITGLFFDTLSHDFNKRVTTIDAELERANVTSFMARFTHMLGRKRSRTKITGDIDAGSMRAMLTLTGTKAHGEDWTSIDGLFELTDPAKGLGLTNLKVVHRGMDGKKIRVGLLDTKRTGGFDLTGLKLRFAPNGTLLVSFDELAAKNLRVRMAGTRIDVPLAKLKHAVIGLQGLAPGQAVDVLGAKLKELQVKGLKVTHTVNRSIPSASGSKSATPDPWIMDAIGGMNGKLQVKVRNAPYVGDVDVPVNIRNGVIDFDDLYGDDGYWPPTGDIWFFMGTTRVWARQVVDVTVYDHKKPIPGATPAHIEWVKSDIPSTPPSEIIHSRGKLNLREFLEGLLNDTSSGSGSPPEQLPKILSDIKIKGGVQLGDDVLGKSKNNVTLSGKSAGKNKITISAVRLGKRLTITMPEYQARKGNFEFLGKKGETGLITADVKVQIKGLGDAPDPKGHLKFKIRLTVLEGKVRDVRFGDVALAEAPALRARPVPPEEKTP